MKSSKQTKKKVTKKVAATKEKKVVKKKATTKKTKQELSLQKEGIYVGITLLVLLVYLIIHYNEEAWSTIFRLWMSHVVLFILPGLALMLVYRKTIPVWERYALGLGIGYGVQPLVLYMINVIIEVNILKYNWLVSLVMIGLGVFLYKKYG